MSWPATQAGRPASWGALALRFALGLRVLADALVEGSAPPSRPLSRAAAWGLAPGCRAPPPTRLSPRKHLSPAASVLLWDVPSWPRVGPPAPWSRVFRAAPSGRPARCVALREAAPPTLGLEFEQWALRLGPCLAAPAAKAAVRPPSPARASAPRLSAAGLACFRRTSCSSRFLDRPAHRSFGFRQLVVLVFFTQRFSSSAWR